MNNVPSLKPYSMLRLVLQEFSLQQSWLYYLLERDLGKLAKLSIHTQHEEWFGSLYSLHGTQEKQFNLFCDKMAGIVLEQLLLCSKGSVRSSDMTLQDWSQKNILQSGVNKRAWEYLISNKFELQYNMAFYHPCMPHTLKSKSARIGSVSIYITIVEVIQKELHNYIVKQMIQPVGKKGIGGEVASPSYDVFAEVNRFVGFAIRSTYDLYQEDSEATELLDLMGSKSCYYGKDYMEKFVSTRDRILDKGGMFFVSPLFFEFGIEVMKMMSTFDLEEMLCNDGPDCIINFQDKIQNNKVILDSFLKAIRSSGKVFKKATLPSLLFLLMVFAAFLELMVVIFCDLQKSRIAPAAKHCFVTEIY